MYHKNSNIKERILQIAELKKVAKADLCVDIGMTYGNFKGSAKNTPLNSDAIAKLLSIFPDVNPVWLILGKGEPLKNMSAENGIFEVLDEVKKLNGEIVGLRDDFKQILQSYLSDRIIISETASKRAANPKDDYVRPKDEEYPKRIRKPKKRD